MVLTEMIGLLTVMLLNHHLASSEVIKPLELLSIPDGDFAQSHEFNGIKSLIQ